MLFTPCKSGTATHWTEALKSLIHWQNRLNRLKHFLLTEQWCLAFVSQFPEFVLRCIIVIIWLDLRWIESSLLWEIRHFRPFTPIMWPIFCPWASYLSMYLLAVESSLQWKKWILRGKSDLLKKEKKIHSGREGCFCQSWFALVAKTASPRKMRGWKKVLLNFFPRNSFYFRKSAGCTDISASYSDTFGCLVFSHL